MPHRLGDGPEQVERLAHILDALEAAHGIAPGHTPNLAIVTETVASLFGLGRYHSLRGKQQEGP